MAQPQFLLEFLIVPFNNPAVFGQLNQILEFGVGRHRRELVLGRFRFLSGFLPLPMITICRTPRLNITQKKLSFDWM